jgi:hypothetical protein
MLRGIDEGLDSRRCGDSENGEWLAEEKLRPAIYILGELAVLIEVGAKDL